ncbi:hypothetical protein [Methylobacterium sp. sgz302541]|uniref:hypothetical protein n=1 Tax=unclassified Methylobacterium TaxID=2615210 RepID=UPI003D348200
MIGIKGLAGGLVGAVIVAGAAMADTSTERAACLRGATPAPSAWSSDGACGHAVRTSHRRTLRPVLAGVDGYPPVTLLRGTPLRFTSLLILGIGY